jgi:hypothetical protein
MWPYNRMGMWGLKKKKQKGQHYIPRPRIRDLDPNKAFKWSMFYNHRTNMEHQ